jgi:hypothetical protein
MSTKVVHLSTEAHTKAKDFCKQHSLRMSEWVAGLIDDAVAQGRADVNVRSTVPKKKILAKLEESAQAGVPEEAVPVYAQPPFWNKG